MRSSISRPPVFERNIFRGDLRDGELNMDVRSPLHRRDILCTRLGRFSAGGNGSPMYPQPHRYIANSTPQR